MKCTGLWRSGKICMRIYSFNIFHIPYLCRSQLLSALGIGPATLVEGAAAAASSSQGGKQQQHQQEEAIARCLVAGLCDHVARRCVGGGDLLMTVPLSSPLFPHAQGPAESVAAADPESPVPVHLSPQSWLCAEKAALADRLYRNPRDSSGGRQGSGGRSEFVVYQVRHAHNQ